MGSEPQEPDGGMTGLIIAPPQRKRSLLPHARIVFGARTSDAPVTLRRSAFYSAPVLREHSPGVIWPLAFTLLPRRLFVIRVVEPRRYALAAVVASRYSA